jgi:hypothetical protein
MSYFDCGKRFEVELRIQGTKRLKELDVPFRREVRVETSDHMDLSDSLIQSVSGGAFNLWNRHLEGVRVASACTERAKLAGEYANIGIIDVAVQDIGCPVAVFTFTDDIGYLAEGIEIVRPKKSKGLLLVDSFSVKDFLVGIPKSWRDQPRVCEIFHIPTNTHNQSSGKQTPFTAAIRRNSYLLRRFI